MKANITRVRRGRLSQSDVSPKPSRWQEIVDQWHIQANSGASLGGPMSRWEVAKVDEIAGGEDYADNMGLRRLGLRSRSLTLVEDVPVAASLPDLRKQLGKARQLAQMLSQQNSGAQYLVLMTGNERQMWGANVLALDSVWNKGQKHQSPGSG